MKTYIYIVRHAQSTGNVEKRLTGRQDYELTYDGKMQAEALANYLANVKFNVAYSSPSIRAIDTIKPIINRNNIKIYIKEQLSEMYFGIYDGWKWEDVNREKPKIHENHIKTNEIMDIPGQETTEHVAQRMYNEIEKIVQENRKKNILIASHGVAIEAFLRKVTGVPFTEEREKYSQKNTSINILTYEHKQFNIEVLNYKINE